MNTNHTPGPWHVGLKPGPIVYGPQGEQVASLHVAMVEQEENKANARLIAQAPALLAALEGLLSTYDDQHGKLISGDTAFAGAYFQARAVIAQAKGETK